MYFYLLILQGTVYYKQGLAHHTHPHKQPSQDSDVITNKHLLSYSRYMTHYNLTLNTNVVLSTQSLNKIVLNIRINYFKGTHPTMYRNYVLRLYW